MPMLPRMGSKRNFSGVILWSACTLGATTLLLVAFLGLFRGETLAPSSTAPTPLNESSLSTQSEQESTSNTDETPIESEANQISQAVDRLEAQITENGGARLLAVIPDGTVLDVAVSDKGEAEMTSRGSTPARTVRTEKAVFVKESEASQDEWKKYSSPPEVISPRLAVAEPAALLKQVAGTEENIKVENTENGERIFTWRLDNDTVSTLLTLGLGATEGNVSLDVDESPSTAPNVSASPSQSALPPEVSTKSETWAQFVLNEAGEFVRLFIAFTDGGSLMLSLTNYEKVIIIEPALPTATPTPTPSPTRSR